MGASCSVIGCTFELKRIRRGMCYAHYKRVQRYGTAELPNREPSPCAVDGCKATTLAKGLCKTHYRRVLSTGSAELKTRHSPSVTGFGNGCVCQGCREAMAAAHGTKHGYAKGKCRCDQCKAAAREYQSGYNAENKAKRQAASRDWYSANGDKVRAYRAENVEAIREGRRQWRKRNIYKARDYTHNRRNRLHRGSGGERISRRAVFLSDNYICYLCGQKTLPDEHHHHPRYPTIDHIKPLILGGTHTYDNVATACKRCNSIKCARFEPQHVEALQARSLLF